MMLSSARRHLTAAINTSGFSRSSNRSGLGPVLEQLGGMMRRLGARSTAARMLLVVLALLAGGAQTARAQSLTCSDVSSVSGKAVSGTFSLTAGSVIATTITNLPANVTIYDQNFATLANYVVIGGPNLYTVGTTGTYYILSVYTAYTVSCTAPQTTFTVNTTADDSTGVAANCATGSTTACTLRDALAAAAASTSTGLMVNFSPTVFLSTNTVAQNTITETGGTLNVPANTTIQGLTTGSGGTLTNLVTVDGNAKYTVFTASGAATVLNNLTITNGGITNGKISTSFGGVYVQSGSLTINQCTISNNNGGSTVGAGGITTASGSALVVNQSLLQGNNGYQGGGIDNAGTLTVTFSTFTGNTSTNDGGGLYNTATGTATLTHVTMTGNTAVGSGGGVYNNDGTMTASYTIVEGNNTVARIYADYYGPGQQSNSLINTSSSSTPTYNATALALSALGSYGGPTQTMPVLPRSPAFCHGHPASAPAASTDQRGFQGSTNYKSYYCIDVGATNSNYGLAWTTQPAAAYAVGSHFTTSAPVVSFEDNGYVLPLTETGVYAGVTLYDSFNQINGVGRVQNVALANGAANVSGGYIAVATTSDTLEAIYSLPSYPFTDLPGAFSNPFAVVSVAGFSISQLPSSAVAGNSSTFTVRALSSLNPVTTATSYTGTVTFTSTDPQASLPSNYTFTSGGAGDNGGHGFNPGVTFKTAGSQTITVADTTAAVSQKSSNVLVSTGAAASLTATGGTTISAAAGAAFRTTALQVQVLDAYSNPVSGALVSFTPPTSGPSATLSAPTCITDTSGMCAVTATANALPGSFAILTTTSSASVYFHATNTGNAILTVTVPTDFTNGVASACTEGSTTDFSCGLRDALAAAAAVQGSSTVPVTIQFGSAFNKATTITENNGSLNVPAYTTIQGLTSGSGASVTNLVTVTGKGTAPVFTIAQGNVGVSINNLTITGGGGLQGGGISNAGGLSVSYCTISGNQLAGQSFGGGIFNAGALLIADSTLTGNSANDGGALFSGGTALTIQYSTFTANQATTGGALLLQGNTTDILNKVTITQNTAVTAGGLQAGHSVGLMLTNTIVSGNGATSQYPDLWTGTITGTGNVLGTATGVSGNGPAPGVAPLGNYGGFTQTMPVLPSGTAFCKVCSTTQGTTSYDQRGVAVPTSYGGKGYCTDAGATNSSYSLAWTTQPASTYYVNLPLSTSPVLQFEDNGYPIPASGVANVVDAYNASSCSANGLGDTLTLSSTGSATWPSTCTFNQTETGDIFNAYQIITIPNAGSYVIQANGSNSFNVVPNVVGFTITPNLPTPETAGTQQTFTVTALSSLSPATTATNYTGTVTFTSTDGQAVLPGSYTFTSGTGADNGVHTFTSGLTFKTAGAAQTITVADTAAKVSQVSNAVQVTAAAASSITATGNTTISTQDATAFSSTALQVQLTDAYGNPVPSATVTYAVQGAIPTATLSSSTCSTNVSGVCAVTATANSQAGTYTITATAAGLPPVTFNATNVGVSNFFVTVFTDTTTGIASHCTEGGSTDVSCSLRDALAAAAAITNSQVNAYILVGAHAPVTITEVNGSMQIPTYTSVGGPLSSTGANLVTVSGNGTGPVFTVPSGESQVALNNMSIEGGGGSQGGGVQNAGVLTVNACSFFANTLSNGKGAGIWNSGTLTVNGSTFYSNTAGSGGGAIFSTGTVTVNSSTITANNGGNGDTGGAIAVTGSATITHTTITGNTGSVGGIANAGRLSLSGSIVAGNDGGDMTGSYTAGAVANIAPPTSGGNASYSAAQLLLAPLGFYGGSTKTMPVLPTSPAFCVVRSSTQGTVSTDQRGVAVPTNYGGKGYCTDAGATNSSYSLAWTTQPASTYYVNLALSTSPVLQFEDNGYPIPASGVANVVDAYTASSCSGSGSGDNLPLSLTGSATWPSACTFNQTETGDIFNAYQIITIPNAGSYVIQANSSNPFNVVPNLVGFTITPNLPTPETAGTSQTFTVTALSSLSPATTATNYTGTVTFTSTDPAVSLPASYTFTAERGRTMGCTRLPAG